MARWVDVDISFDRRNNGDIKSVSNEDAIGNSITNIFSTFQGSRRMVPEFAAPIYELLFEPVDEITANNIGNMLLSAIERWEDRIQVEGLHIEANPDYNKYNCFLRFKMINSETVQTMNFVLFAR